MGKELVERREPTALDRAGQAANRAAAKHLFAEYQERKAENTLKQQRATLALFADYLCQVGVEADGSTLATDPGAWRGVTWGLVEGFREWLKLQGFAISTVNVRLSTVKTYAKLAAKAGAIDQPEYAMIRLVEGYAHREAGKIDDKRRSAGIPTRVGNKKSEPVRLSPEQAEKLADQPNTPQGRRDRLIVSLMLDLGLRVGEVAALQVEDMDLERGELIFDRPKVDLTQRHTLAVNDLLPTVRSYLKTDALDAGPLLRSSRKDRSLRKAGMSEAAITARVRDLGDRIGVEGLSAHDLRHHWATQAARSGTPLDRLRQAGGWKSYAMPLRYIEDAEIANEGIKLNGAINAGSDTAMGAMRQ